MGQVALAPGCAREYETIYILRPSVDREAADDVANRVAEAIKTQQGLLLGAELWGRRRLAYQIQKHHRGIYVFVRYLGKGHTVSEIERQLRLVDHVIRYQTIQTASNVPVAEAQADDAALKIDFELPSEPDEPEISYEKELGLDGTQSFDRGPRRRDRDDDMGDDDGDTDGDVIPGSAVVRDEEEEV